MAPLYRYEDGKTGNDHDYEKYDGKINDGKIWRDLLVLDSMAMDQVMDMDGGIWMAWRLIGHGSRASMILMRDLCSLRTTMCGVRILEGYVFNVAWYTSALIR